MTWTRTLSLTWTATRWFSFPASVVSAVLGAATAWSQSHATLHPGHLLLTIVGVMAMHAAANIFNDYFDFRRGVDRVGTYGSSGVLTAGRMSPKNLFLLGILFNMLAAGIGGYLFYQTGPWVLWLGLLGAALAFIYTWGPELKYRALGDPAVFIAFGSLIALGAYYVQTSRLSWQPVLYSIPLGLLIDAILHGNNLRDIDDDAKAGVVTLAGHLGVRGAQLFYFGLVGGAYLTVAILIAGMDLPRTSAVVIVSLPIAWRNVRMVANVRTVSREVFAPIDAMGAQLELVFGCLFVIGIALGRWI